MLENNKRFASLSNFKVNTINSSNYQAYLSEEGEQKIRKCVQDTQTKNE
jgi:hypothetical protein